MTIRTTHNTLYAGNIAYPIPEKLGKTSSSAPIGTRFLVLDIKTAPSNSAKMWYKVGKYIALDE